MNAPFAMLPKWLVARIGGRERLTWLHAGLYAMLADAERIDAGPVALTYGTLADAVGVSRHTAIRGVQKLEAVGLLKVQRDPATAAAKHRGVPCIFRTARQAEAEAAARQAEADNRERVPKGASPQAGTSPKPAPERVPNVRLVQAPPPNNPPSMSQKNEEDKTPAEAAPPSTANAPTPPKQRSSGADGDQSNAEAAEVERMFIARLGPMIEAEGYTVEITPRARGRILRCVRARGAMGAERCLTLVALLADAAPSSLYVNNRWAGRAESIFKRPDTARQLHDALLRRSNLGKRHVDKAGAARATPAEKAAETATVAQVVEALGIVPRTAGEADLNTDWNDAKWEMQRQLAAVKRQIEGENARNKGGFVRERVAC